MGDNGDTALEAVKNAERYVGSKMELFQLSYKELNNLPEETRKAIRDKSSNIDISEYMNFDKNNRPRYDVKYLELEINDYTLRYICERILKEKYDAENVYMMSLSDTPSIYVDSGYRIIGSFHSTTEMHSYEHKFVIDPKTGELGIGQIDYYERFNVYGVAPEGKNIESLSDRDIVPIKDYQELKNFFEKRLDEVKKEREEQSAKIPSAIENDEGMEINIGNPNPGGTN